jgi:hypothetical protein
MTEDTATECPFCERPLLTAVLVTGLLVALALQGVVLWLQL